jgi:large subunit ribosomal protein L10
LRRLLKGSGAEYKVIKNTLINIAAKGTPFESAKESFTGTTGIAFGFDDAVEVAKKVLEYSGKNDKLKIKSGVIEGKLYFVDEIKAISTLPPKNVLLGIMAGAMQSPASKLAGVLNAAIAQLAYALEALKTKKGVS